MITTSRCRSIERGNRSLGARSRSPVCRTRKVSPTTRSLSPIRRLHTFGSNLTKQKKVLRTVSADRDKSYFNILGTDGLVGTDSVLQQIEMIHGTKSITKLELEDILCRKQNQKEILDAIQKLLSDDSRSENDNQQGQGKWSSIDFFDTFSSSDEITNEDDTHQGRRLWSSIKFLDTIQLSESDPSPSSALSKLSDYERKQKPFWDLKIDHCGEETTNRCLTFEAKIMVDEGCSIETLLNLMEMLQTSQNYIEKVQFGGGLFGYSEAEVPKKLASLLRKDSKATSSDLINNHDGNNSVQDDSHSFFTSQMVMMNLLYASPHLESREVPAVIPKCIKRMTNLRAGIRTERVKRSRSSKSPTIRSRSESSTPESHRARSASPKPSVGKALPKRSRSTSPKPVSRGYGRKIQLKNTTTKNTAPVAIPSVDDHPSHNQIPYQRQNSTPETELDIRRAVSRRNSPDFRWDSPDFRWDKMIAIHDQAVVQRSSAPSAA